MRCFIVLVVAILLTQTTFAAGGGSGVATVSRASSVASIGGSPITQVFILSQEDGSLVWDGDGLDFDLDPSIQNAQLRTPSPLPSPLYASEEGLQRSSATPIAKKKRRRGAAFVHGEGEGGSEAREDPEASKRPIKKRLTLGGKVERTSSAAAAIASPITQAPAPVQLRRAATIAGAARASCEAQADPATQMFTPRLRRRASSLATDVAAMFGRITPTPRWTPTPRMSQSPLVLDGEAMDIEGAGEGSDKGKDEVEEVEEAAEPEFNTMPGPIEDFVLMMAGYLDDQSKCALAKVSTTCNDLMKTLGLWRDRIKFQGEPVINCDSEDLPNNQEGLYQGLSADEWDAILNSEENETKFLRFVGAYPITRLDLDGQIHRIEELLAIQPRGFKYRELKLNEVNLPEGPIAGFDASCLRSLDVARVEAFDDNWLIYCTPPGSIITSLRLVDVPITDAGIDHVIATVAPNLQYLTLAGNSRLSPEDEGFGLGTVTPAKIGELLAACSNLEGLDISDMNFELHRAANLTNLSKLTLWSSPVTTPSFCNLVINSPLETIEFYECGALNFDIKLTDPRGVNITLTDVLNRKFTLKQLDWACDSGNLPEEALTIIATGGNGDRSVLMSDGNGQLTLPRY